MTMKLAVAAVFLGIIGFVVYLVWNISSITVVAELGHKPVPGATVQLTHYLPRGRGQGWGYGEAVTEVRTTNGFGRIFADISHVDSIYVEHPGFYGSFARPSGSHVIVLREKIAPGPMLVKEVVIHVVPNEPPINLDLLSQPEVLPAGSMRRSTCTMEVRGSIETKDRFRCDLRMQFNPSTGLLHMPRPLRQPTSAYRLVQTAPTTGYTAQFAALYAVDRSDENRRAMEAQGFKQGELRYRQGIYTIPWNEDDNYLVKISKEDGHFYGKIHGPITMGIDDDLKGVSVRFRIYLNPTAGSTGIEWDTEHNLAGPTRVGLDP
jgi:hypothetical protein